MYGFAPTIVEGSGEGGGVEGGDHAGDQAAGRIGHDG